MSAGNRAGVNCTRANCSPSAVDSDLAISVSVSSPGVLEIPASASAHLMCGGQRSATLGAGSERAPPDQAGSPGVGLSWFYAGVGLAAPVVMVISSMSPAQ